MMYATMFFRVKLGLSPIMLNWRMGKSMCHLVARQKGNSLPVILQTAAGVFPPTAPIRLLMIGSDASCALSHPPQLGVSMHTVPGEAAKTTHHPHTHTQFHTKNDIPLPPSQSTTDKHTSMKHCRLWQHLRLQVWESFIYIRHVHVWENCIYK